MISKAEILVLLKDVDGKLTEPATIIVIGGMAAVVHYGTKDLTNDADTWNRVTSDLASAWEKACAATGVPLSLGQAGVADGPYEFESRLQPLQNLHLNYLRVFFPEIHDLVLMKTVRLLGKDRTDISNLCANGSVHADILLQRFFDEMGHIMGDRLRLKLNYLEVIDTNFGADIADDHEAILSARGR